MQGMINELQEQQLVAMHALVESSQQCMRQEMCAALAEASGSARQGPTPGPERYEDFSHDSDAAGNDGTKYSTRSSSKHSVPPSTIRQSSLIRQTDRDADGVMGGGVGGARRPQLPATDSPQNPVRPTTHTARPTMDAHHTQLTTPCVITASKTKAGGQDQTGRLRLKRAPAHTIMKAGA